MVLLLSVSGAEPSGMTCTNLCPFIEGSCEKLPLVVAVFFFFSVTDWMWSTRSTDITQFYSFSGGQYFSTVRRDLDMSHVPHSGLCICSPISCEFASGSTYALLLPREDIVAFV